MDNIRSAKADFVASAAALREPHLWIMSILYIGTFGSFIGFAGVFPKVIATQFPEFSAFHVGAAAVSLAFMGALVGSLARPFGGKLADRFGGAKVTFFSFAVMALGALAVVLTLPVGNFWLFLVTFMVIFTATGIGNGATYRMIPSIFSARNGVVERAHAVGRRRNAAQDGCRDRHHLGDRRVRRIHHSAGARSLTGSDRQLRQRDLRFCRGVRRADGGDGVLLPPSRIVTGRASNLGSTTHDDGRSRDGGNALSLLRPSVRDDGHRGLPRPRWRSPVESFRRIVGACARRAGRPPN